MQVLTNLLSNAAKFSASEGKVTISTSRDCDFVYISVSDNGHGIPEKFQGKIFEKFMQVDFSDTRKKGGTGLGLNISKKIIERLNGKIGFRSKEGEGSTFYFKLPIYNYKEKINPQYDKISNQSRILICEDDEGTASLIALILKQKGYKTDIAYSAEQTKQLLLKNTYNLITMELLLPDQDGLFLIRDIRDKGINTPIIVVSVRAN